MKSALEATPDGRVGSESVTSQQVANECLHEERAHSLAVGLPVRDTP